MISEVCAYSIGVSPDKLIFENETAKIFTIINPNNEAVDFTVENDYFEFEPQIGTIDAKSSRQITAKIKKQQNRETNIIIKFQKDATIIPGVILKAEMIHNKPEIDDHTFTWLLVFFSTIFFGFFVFLIILEVIKWLRN